MYSHTSDFVCWACMQDFADIETGDLLLDPNVNHWLCSRCNSYETLTAAAKRDGLTDYEPLLVPSLDAMTVCFS